MPITNDSLNKRLYQLLKVQGYDPIPKNSKGDTTPVPDEAEVFRFTFKVDGKPVGPAWVTIDSNQDLKIYYDDETMGSVNEDGGAGHIDDFTEFLQQLKQWAQRRQLGFDVENQDHLESDMAQREYMKKQEQINEGYYPMGKSASYNDSIPSVKIILQHTRQIQEGEQRFRNIARIFLENTVGERILAPTTRPGIAKVYARHLAEGGLPHDDRWNHIGSLVEEYTKMAGFVRATRGNQFNESAQQLVNEGINHYQSLRETLSRMIGHKGYNAYFENYTPALMEDETDSDTLNELFVQETMDPRIESVMPILSRLQKKVNEMSEVKELEEWANNLLEAPGAETLAHNQSTAKSNLKAFGLAEEDGEEAAKKIETPAVQRKQKGGDWKVSTQDLEKAKEKNISGPEGIKALHKRLQKADEGIGDVAKKVGSTLKKVGQKALDTLGHGSDEELLKDLQKRAGVPAYAQHGKLPGARPNSDRDDLEEDLGPEQKRVGQLGPTEKITKKNPLRGKLVGANESVEQDVAEQQLNEIGPLVAAGARAMIPLLGRIGPVLGRMASSAGKVAGQAAKTGAGAVTQGAGQAAKTGAEIAAKNAGSIGLGAGAYSAITDIAKSVTGGIGEVYRDVGDATSALAKALGNAVDSKTLGQLAMTAVKYSIPIGMLIAVLYGGKKVIDKVLSEGNPDNKTGLIGQLVGAATPNPSDFTSGFEKTYENTFDDFKNELGGAIPGTERKINEMDKAHKKPVKEGQEDLDAILRIIRK